MFLGLFTIFFVFTPVMIIVKELVLDYKIVYDSLDYTTIIEKAVKAADITVQDYVSRKQISSTTANGLGYQQEITGLFREEISYEIEKEVNGGTSRSSSYYVTVADLSKNTKFTDAYAAGVPQSVCASKEVSCDSSSKYRTADGTCNNLNSPLWGSAFTAQERLLSPVYEDGIRAARSTSVMDGSALLSPREISNKFLFSNSSNPQTSKFTVMLMAWGQFIDHDFVFTPISKDESGMDCCNDQRVECLPISIPAGDPRFGGHACMKLTRSAPGPLLRTDCAPEPRHQVNQLTSFLDASSVYGSTVAQSNDLRNNTGGTLLALMNVSSLDLPPANVDSVCTITDPQYYCLKAGDARVNVVPNLSFTHALFVREHNRLVTKLRMLKPSWDEETLFQETRRIVAAMNQHITYAEYLPKTLSSNTMTKYGLTSSKNDPYDPIVNPSITNVFGVAAFRFGHSQVNDHQAYFSPNNTRTRNSRLREVFKNPEMIERDNGDKVSHLARWLVSDQGMEVDRFMEVEVRDFLFTDFDLASLNMQRGREHGIPSYTEWRKYCNLSEITVWDDMQNHTVEAVNKLKEVYKTPRDIDLFAGGLSEAHETGEDVGPTFACLLGVQFKAVKIGDRFWYERTNVMDPTVGFTPDQITAIKNVTLASLICNNVDVGFTQPDAFRLPDELNDAIDPNDPSNELKPCSEYQDALDLTAW